MKTYRTQCVVNFERVAKQTANSPCVSIVYGDRGIGKTTAARYVEREWIRLKLPRCKIVNLFAREKESRFIRIAETAIAPSEKPCVTTSDAIVHVAGCIARENTGLIIVDNAHLLMDEDVENVCYLIDCLNNTKEHPTGVILVGMEFKENPQVAIRKSGYLREAYKIPCLAKKEILKILIEQSPACAKALEGINPDEAPEKMPPNIRKNVGKIYGAVSGNFRQLRQFCHDIEIYFHHTEPTLAALDAFLETRNDVLLAGMMPQKVEQELPLDNAIPTSYS